MNVAQTIEWLKTFPQDAKVDVLVEDVDYGWDGENEYQTTYVSEQSLTLYDYDKRASYDKKTNTLLMGVRY